MAKIIYEEESYKIICACMAAHNELGCGFLAAVYQEAPAIERQNLNISFEQEKHLDLFFRNIKLKEKYIVCTWINNQEFFVLLSMVPLYHLLFSQFAVIPDSQAIPIRFLILKILLPQFPGYVSEWELVHRKN